MGDWNVETYRAREREWRQKAGIAVMGEERNACMLVAEGYANLIAVLEDGFTRGTGGGGTDWQRHAFFER